MRARAAMGVGLFRTARMNVRMELVGGPLAEHSADILKGGASIPGSCTRPQAGLSVRVLGFGRQLPPPTNGWPEAPEGGLVGLDSTRPVVWGVSQTVHGDSERQPRLRDDQCS